MKRYQVILLCTAAAITALLFWHDYLYDYNPYPMTPADYALEILLSGSLYVGMIYLLLYGCYRIIRPLFRQG